MAIVIMYAVLVNFELFMFLPASLANLGMKQMLEKNDGKQMEREVAAKRVREEEYEEANQIKGLKLTCTVRIIIPIFEDVVVAILLNIYKG